MISRPCVAQMHAACHDWDNCGCDCHCECQRCDSRCRRLYRADDGSLVCADCRKVEINRDVPAPCQRCGKGAAYRRPGINDDRFLCGDCHTELGHPATKSPVTKS